MNILMDELKKDIEQLLDNYIPMSSGDKREIVKKIMDILWYHAEKVLSKIKGG